MGAKQHPGGRRDPDEAAGDAPAPRRRFLNVLGPHRGFGAVDDREVRDAALSQFLAHDAGQWVALGLCNVRDREGLGVFLVAFWLKFVKGNAVFYAAVISELLVIIIYKLDVISFLWLNVIGAVLVFALSCLIQPFIKEKAL